MCQLEVDLLAQQNGRAGADLYLSYKVKIFYPKQQTKSNIFSKIICLTFSHICMTQIFGMAWQAVRLDWQDETMRNRMIDVRGLI